VKPAGIRRRLQDETAPVRLDDTSFADGALLSMTPTKLAGEVAEGDDGLVNVPSIHEIADAIQPAYETQEPFMVLVSANPPRPPPRGW
jgi:hypothetical protein